MANEGCDIERHQSRRRFLVEYVKRWAGRPADPRNGSELNWVLNVAQKVMGAVNVDTEKLAREFTTAWDADVPTVIVVATKPQPAHLG